jgi:hypothetical protein
MFLGLLDPDPLLLVRGTDPDPDPSVIKQEKPEILLFSLLYDFLSLKNDVNVASKVISQKTWLFIILPKVFSLS